MNSKFLKKVALSCLVLGAVNYGNIGNTMEAVEIGEEELIINNQEENISITKTEEAYKIAVGNKKANISVKDIMLPKFDGKKEIWGSNNDFYIELLNDFVEKVQDVVNYTRRGRIELVYQAFERYKKYKNILFKDVKTFLADQLNAAAESLNYQLSNEQLEATINNELGGCSEIIGEAETDFAKNAEQVGNFRELLSNVMPVIVQDFDILNRYMELGSNAFSGDLFFNEKKNRIDPRKTKYGDYKDFLYKGTGCFDDELTQAKELKYSEAGTMVQLYLKYATKDVLKERELSMGGNYIIDDESVEQFRGAFELLRDICKQVIAKTDIFEFFTSGENAINFTEEVREIIAQEKEKKNQEISEISKKTKQKIANLQNVITHQEQSMFDTPILANMNKNFVQFKQLKLDKQNDLFQKLKDKTSNKGTTKGKVKDTNKIVMKSETESVNNVISALNNKKTQDKNKALGKTNQNTDKNIYTKQDKKEKTVIKPQDDTKTDTKSMTQVKPALGGTEIGKGINMDELNNTMAMGDSILKKLIGKVNKKND